MHLLNEGDVDPVHLVECVACLVLFESVPTRRGGEGEGRGDLMYSSV